MGLLGTEHYRDVQHRLLRPLVAFALAAAAEVAFALGDRARGVDWLLRANRYTDGRHFAARIRRRLTEIRAVAPRMLGAPLSLESLDPRCCVLADPVSDGGRVLRKGVVLIKFTETAGKLFVSTDMAKLDRSFHVVLEPSWSGYADPAILCWLNMSGPVIVQATEELDRKLLSDLAANLVPVPYGSGDWIDPARFAPALAIEKEYDAICVANFGWWKRVHAFLRAAGRAAQELKSYKGLLVLASLGRTDDRERRLHAMIKRYGLEAHLTVLVSVPQSELSTLLAKSRVLAFTSWKEGSSRVLFEAMAMNTPVIVLKENVGVNKEYINAHTGSLVAERELAAELVQYALGNRARTPRAWFTQNLGPENTTRKLAADLDAIIRDEEWKADDLRVKANSPEARYVDAGEAVRPLSAWLAEPSAYIDRKHPNHTEESLC